MTSNTLTVMEQRRGTNGVTLVGLGGQHHNWRNAFMGHITTTTIKSMRADLLIMSTAAITENMVFHETQDAVDVKQATFESSTCRILLADHTKFGRRAVHAMVPLIDFDAVAVDGETDPTLVARLRAKGVTVEVAGRA